MVLGKLGSSLHKAVQKLLRSSIVDEKAVKELVKDLQRALLQADVNVHLVMDLTKRIESRSLKDDIAPGVSRREYVVKVVYEELTDILNQDIKKAEEQLSKEPMDYLGLRDYQETLAALISSREYNPQNIVTAFDRTYADESPVRTNPVASNEGKGGEKSSIISKH